MKLLTAVGPERMKFTQIDQELYDSFRENFPDFNIENVDEESMKVRRTMLDSVRVLWYLMMARP